MQMRIIGTKELEKTVVAAFIIAPSGKRLLDTRKMIPIRMEKAATIARMIHFRNCEESGAELSLPL